MNDRYYLIKPEDIKASHEYKPDPSVLKEHQWVMFGRTYPICKPPLGQPRADNK